MLRNPSGIDRPHPQINSFQYWELRVLWLLLRGECFRIPIYESSSSSSSSSIPSSPRNTQHAIRNTEHAHRASLAPSDGERAGERGSPLSTLNSQNHQLRKILILDPSRFHHIIEHGQLLGWRYTALGPQAPLESQVFLPEEVWHDKLPNPFDFWRGLSPLQVAAAAAQTDFAASSFMRGLIENNAENGLIVRADHQLSDDQREQIASALRQRKRRAGAADRSILLWGATEIVKPTLSSADLQFLENRKFSRAEICAAFGVPEEIVATSDHNKYDVMQGARLNFIENRIAPLCARLEAEENATTIPALLGASLNSQLSTINSPVIGWFDLDSLPIMQQARRARLAAARVAFELGIPLNELNRLLDLGVKPLPWGDIGYVPSTVQPVSDSNGAGAPPAGRGAASNTGSSAPNPQPSHSPARSTDFQVRSNMEKPRRDFRETFTLTAPTAHQPGARTFQSAARWESRGRTSVRPSPSLPLGRATPERGLSSPQQREKA